MKYTKFSEKTAAKTVLSMITGDVYGGDSLRYTFTDDAGRVCALDGFRAFRIAAPLEGLPVLPDGLTHVDLERVYPNAAGLIESASSYFIGLSFGFPATNGIKYLSSFMSIDNDKKLPVVATSVMTVADIILDVLVLKVWSGSMLGFGLATSISYWISFLILCTHFFKKDIFFKNQTCAYHFSHRVNETIAQEVFIAFL